MTFGDCMEMASRDFKVSQSFILHMLCFYPLHPYTVPGRNISKQESFTVIVNLYQSLSIDQTSY